MTDPALNFKYPRLLSAVYFGLLSILASYLIEVYLVFFGVIVLLPLFKSILLAIVVSAIFGALFAKRILYTTKPYYHKAFNWGFIMTLAAIPFHSLGMMLCLLWYQPNMAEGSGFVHYANFYLFILSYSFLLAGLWIAILAGIAAIVLRHHIVYQIMENDS